LEEIFLYDNGLTKRLTNDTIRDVIPEINDHGHVVWTHGPDGYGGGTMAFYDGDSVRMLFEGTSGTLNVHDHIAWKLFGLGGCEDADSDIFFYDGLQTERLTQDSNSNQGVSLSDLGTMVWTRYDFCRRPWTSEIVLYQDSEETILPSRYTEPRWPSVNLQRQVAWGGQAIELWENGNTIPLTDSGVAPVINDSGRVAFNRWDELRFTWDAWVYDDGGLVQLTFLDEWIADLDLANDGEMVWSTYAFPVAEGDVYHMRRIRNGESDFDGDVDLDDAASLHECLTGPGDFDRLCDCRFLDIDHDRDVDLGDFVLFQRNYTGSE
jgi:hypothetical protein